MTSSFAFVRRAALCAAAISSFVTGSCKSSEDGPLLERSCTGRAVPNCLPYEYSEVLEASMTPTELEVGDVRADAMIHVKLATCGASAPGPHTVIVQLLASRGSGEQDGGASLMVFPLAELRDDGMNGDAVAKDGLVDVTIGNPLIGAVPPSADVQLRFMGRGGATCDGASLQVPYRTGPRHGTL